MIEEMYRAAAHELAERGARLMHEAVGAQNEATSSDEKLALLAVRTSLDLGSGAIGLSPSCDSSLGASAHNRHRSDPSRCPQRRVRLVRAAGTLTCAHLPSPRDSTAAAPTSC